MNKGLFDNVKILDFTQIVAGPFATMQLALQGAEVIKVERPREGDMMRSIMAEPPFRDQNTSAGFIAFNLSKKSLTLDLKAEPARDILAPLVTAADVVVENFRPGVMAGLGLDAETLRRDRPDLVYCSISGFGQTGPSSGKRAYDGAIQAESGMMSVTGYAGGDPLRAGYFAVDIPTGYAAAFAIAGALLKAQTTGKGCYLDVAMTDTALSLMAMQINEYFQHDTVPKRLGNMSAARTLSDNCYATADGAISIVALTQPQIKALHQVLGLTGIPTAADMAAVFRTATSRDWHARLSSVGVPSGIVRDLPEALADPQLEMRTILSAVQRPTGLDGEAVTVVGSPFVVSPTATIAQPAPSLGEHTEDLLRNCGFTMQQIENWRAAGVV